MPSEIGRAERLKLIREQLKWSQAELGDRAPPGTKEARSWFAKVEQKKNQARSEDIQNALAFAFGVSRERLIAALDGELPIEEFVAEVKGADEARKGALAESAAPTRTIEYVPRYHNARIALRDIRDEGGEIPEEVVRSVDSIALASEEDPPVRFWRSAYDQASQLHRKHVERTAEAVRRTLGGTTLEDDKPPPRAKR